MYQPDLHPAYWGDADRSAEQFDELVDTVQHDLIEWFNVVECWGNLHDNNQQNNNSPKPLAPRSLFLR